MNDDAVDFALVVWHEEGRWEMTALPPRLGASFDSLVQATKGQLGDRGAMGMVCIDEDFFVLVRSRGDHVSALLSDVSAASEWPIAAAVLAHEDVPEEDVDDDDVVAVGDLDLLTDLGVSAEEIERICADIDQYPDEMLAQIAKRLGFGAAFDEMLEQLP